MKAEDNRLTLIPAVYADNTLVLEWHEAEAGQPIKAEGQRIRLEHTIFTLHRDKKRTPFFWLLALGSASMNVSLSEGLHFFREIARTFTYKARQAFSSKKSNRSVLILSGEEAEELLSHKPSFPGAERVDLHFLAGLWGNLSETLAGEISAFNGTLDEYMSMISPTGSHADRVHFHLVENRLDEERPFAFLATYSSLDTKGILRHLPLSRALDELGGDQKKLLGLLAAVREVAKTSAFIRELLDSGELFHPIGLTMSEAHVFLKEAELYEEAGILCKVPNWWRNRRSSLKLGISIGGTTTKLGAEALMDVSMRMLVDGEEITETDMRRILSETAPFAMIKGKWVAVNRESLKRVRLQFERAKKIADKNGIPMAEAIKLIMDQRLPDLDDEIPVEVSAGKWLESVMEKLKTPSRLDARPIPQGLCAELRPYQQEGYRWLCFLSGLGFGGCLADDMGLGKTVQMIAFLLERCKEADGRPNLVVAPTSLLENWKAELDRFAPRLSYGVFHSSGMSGREVQMKLPSLDILLTTYGMCTRAKWLADVYFDCIVLDEAQAIKNMQTSQSRAVKKLKGARRFLMTGTPVENRLTDLWSLFDFANPGLLGTESEFRDYMKKAGNSPERYGRLRQAVAPYILRRMKTDKHIIADLPEKTECRIYAKLSKKQAVLYTHLVERLEHDLEVAYGPAKRGIVLGYIIKFKQLCNHPDQYAGLQGYDIKESGKFLRLAELCEKIHEDREKVLVFTQFTEIMEPLADVLEGVFGSRGVSLSGEMSVSKRREAVKRFQNDPAVRFFVLSVRAGGFGLNLTAASQVIHFDRWWNPAVENQATDRAFRIGQDRRVLVHKFITSGTVEEKIDSLIEEKKTLANDVVDSVGAIITGMSDRQIVSLFSYGLK